MGAPHRAAQALIARAGWTLVKGPSIFMDRAEVSLTVAEAARAEVAQAFLAQTGYRLTFGAPLASSPPAKRDEPPVEVVEIPVARIRLTAHQQGLTLDPEKSRKAVERAQRAGCISPPARVRRARDGYVLLDGLYRLRAAQALGWERIAAIVE